MATHKLLVPLDGSEFSRQVLSPICRLFSPDEYEIVLFRVGEEPEGVSTAASGEVFRDGMLMPVYVSEFDVEHGKRIVYASQVWETSAAAMRDELMPDVQTLQQAGFKVVPLVRFGDPAEEIVAYAENEHIDLVVMATHSRTGLMRFVLGSVAEQVLRNISVPVMMIRPT